MTEQMKPSGVACIGDIPSNWQVKRLKYACQKITDGSHFSPDTIDEGKIYITVSDLYGNTIHTDTAKRIAPSDFTELVKNGCQPQKGDVLLSKDGTVGRSAIVDNNNDYVVLSSIGMLTPGQMVSSNYLKYNLDGIHLQEQMLRAMDGSALKRITISKIAEFFAVIPPIEEQNVIADFLDAQCTKIDGIIVDIEKQIETLQKYKKSLITETVTKGLDKSMPMKDSGIEWIGNIPKHWNVKRVKYVIDSIKDGTHGTFDRVDTGEYLLSAKNVFDDGIRIGQNESEISVTDYKSIVANGYPQKSDVLLCCVGTVGRCCVYEFDKPYAFQRSVSFLRPLSSTDSFFLQFALQSNSTLIQEQLLINKSAQDGLYMGSVRELIIAIPDSIEEQKSISRFLKTKVAYIDELIVNKEQQLEKIQQHKKSLIYEYVTGKKRVTEVN